MRGVIAMGLLALAGCDNTASQLEGQYEAASRDLGAHAQQCKIARKLVEHYSDSRHFDKANEWNAKARGDCAMWNIIRDASQRSER